MNYKNLSNCWNGVSVYNLNGDNEMFRQHKPVKEEYNPVTVPLGQYVNYSAGPVNANMAADAGLSLGGTLPGGVVKGHVSQNGMTAMMRPHGKITGLQSENPAGLGWIN
jgi:hypothetical protein